jgi:hypothetical protein
VSTVPTLRTWVAGEVTTAAFMNANIRDALNWLLSSKPVFSAVQTVAQSLANITWTSITFTAEILDRDNGHSTSTNTSRYTGQTPGYYNITGVGAVVATTGPVLAGIAKNGTRITGSVTQSSGNGTTGVAAASAPAPRVQLNGTTDYVELQVYQGSGAAANTSLTEICCALNVEWAGN